MLPTCGFVGAHLDHGASCNPYPGNQPFGARSCRKPAASNKTQDCISKRQAGPRLLSSWSSRALPGIPSFNQKPDENDDASCAGQQVVDGSTYVMPMLCQITCCLHRQAMSSYPRALAARTISQQSDDQSFHIIIAVKEPSSCQLAGLVDALSSIVEGRTTLVHVCVQEQTVTQDHCMCRVTQPRNQPQCHELAMEIAGIQIMHHFHIITHCVCARSCAMMDLIRSSYQGAMHLNIQPTSLARKSCHLSKQSWALMAHSTAARLS